MATGLKPISQKQYKVTGDLGTFFFTSATAVEENYEETEYNDGETGQTMTHLGFIKVGKVTLKVNFDPVVHKPLVSWWQTYKKDRKEFTISITPVQADLEGSPIAGALSWKLTSCKCPRFKYPQADRESTGMSTLEMDVLPTAVATQ